MTSILEFEKQNKNSEILEEIKKNKKSAPRDLNYVTHGTCSCTSIYVKPKQMQLLKFYFTFTFTTRFLHCNFKNQI